MSLLDNHYYREYMKRFASDDFVGARECLGLALPACKMDSDRVKIYLAMVSTYVDAGNIDVASIERCFDLAEELDTTQFCLLARAQFYGHVLNDLQLYIAALSKAKASIIENSDGIDPEDDDRICREIDEEIADAKSELRGHQDTQ